MKAVVELTTEEAATYTKMENNVLPLRRFIKYTRRTGYAHYEFEGTYSPELIAALGRDPYPEEIIIMIDNGFSHFGASCTISSRDCSFRGRVNTD